MKTKYSLGSSQKQVAWPKKSKRSLSIHIIKPSPILCFFIIPGKVWCDSQVYSYPKSSLISYVILRKSITFSMPSFIIYKTGGKATPTSSTIWMQNIMIWTNHSAQPGHVLVIQWLWNEVIILKGKIEMFKAWKKNYLKHYECIELLSLLQRALVCLLWKPNIIV